MTRKSLKGGFRSNTMIIEDRGKAHPQYSYRLTAILGNGLVDEEAMATSLTEVESILNPRPVCAISDDSSDPEPLTPNHLLL